MLKHPRNLGVLLTLFQSEGADYTHHITGFENLTTSLRGVQQSFVKTGGIKSIIDLLIQIPMFICPDEIYLLTCE